MLDSVALDVVIGLVFIFLMYSLLATTINEGVASVLNLRGKKLEQALAKMLNDGINYHENVWTLVADFFIKKWIGIKRFFHFIFSKKVEKPKHKMSLLELFYDHPSIKYLGENKVHNKPSYISPEFFAKSLIDILKKKGQIAEPTNSFEIQAGINTIKNSNETKSYIQTLLDESGNDLDKFKELLEKWFNETMHRTSGWYKKQSQKITFVIGLVLAISFNVDTIAIVGILSKDKDASKKLTALSAQYIENHKDNQGNLTPEEDSIATLLLYNAKKQIETDITGANSIIGLGWTFPIDTIVTIGYKKAIVHGKQIKIKESKEKVVQLGVFDKMKFIFQEIYTNKRKMYGYLITALAISFGAPFWFDLLNKIMQIRGAGKKPEEKKA